MSKSPDINFMLQHPAHILALGLGSGLAPRAPGTFGTLAAIPFWLLMAPLPFFAKVLIVFASFIIGIWLCEKTSNSLGVHDHGGIVWDEFVGFWLTMLFAPAGLIWLLAGFGLFRFFDIVKPWPIKLLDQKVHGGFGIMIDDVLAGLFAGLSLLAISAWI
ncbi:phosphatidylglycerophosphatase A [Pseudomonadales bacterium]|nr:phosphatidylglycerophosphatase A [Pseudomonadales bacterium]